MKVLVACEESGIVREAFRDKGHDAWSCDILPTKQPGQHYQQDIFTKLGDWDLPTDFDIMIAHPPCTHLAVSGARWFETKQVEQRRAIWFFAALAYAPVCMICIENPVSIISTAWRKPDQIIQPYQYGHPESKKTCLWLKNLPLLKTTKLLEMPDRGYWDNQTPSGQNKLGPSPNRAKKRSKTYSGIAKAMANQWG